MDEAGAAVRLTRYLAAPIGEVWAALTERDSVARWIGDVAGFDRSRVRSTQDERVLELDWQPEGEEPSIVRFEVTPHEGGTRLVLDHRRLDERACMAYARTWTDALDRLDRRMAGAAP